MKAIKLTALQYFFIILFTFNLFWANAQDFSIFEKQKNTYIFDISQGTHLSEKKKKDIRKSLKTFERNKKYKIAFILRDSILSNQSHLDTLIQVFQKNIEEEHSGFYIVLIDNPLQSIALKAVYDTEEALTNEDANRIAEMVAPIFFGSNPNYYQGIKRTFELLEDKIAPKQYAYFNFVRILVYVLMLIFIIALILIARPHEIQWLPYALATIAGTVALDLALWFSGAVFPAFSWLLLLVPFVVACSFAYKVMMSEVGSPTYDSIKALNQLNRPKLKQRFLPSEVDIMFDGYLENARLAAKADSERTLEEILEKVKNVIAKPDEFFTARHGERLEKLAQEIRLQAHRFEEIHRDYVLGKIESEKFYFNDIPAKDVSDTEIKRLEDTIMKYEIYTNSENDIFNKYLYVKQRLDDSKFWANTRAFYYPKSEVADLEKEFETAFKTPDLLDSRAEIEELYLKVRNFYQNPEQLVKARHDIVLKKLEQSPKFKSILEVEHYNKEKQQDLQKRFADDSAYFDSIAEQDLSYEDEQRLQDALVFYKNIFQNPEQTIGYDYEWLRAEIDKFMANQPWEEYQDKYTLDSIYKAQEDFDFRYQKINEFPDRLELLPYFYFNFIKELKKNTHKFLEEV